jgi:hypothetical protein
MKLVKVTLALAMLLGAVASEPALANHQRGGRVHFGFVFGGPLWYPYPYPYYAYPPVVVREAPPTTYIEQGSAETAPAQQGYWYYCADSKAYYPYVKDCPGGWQRVAPQPQPGR